MNWASTEFESLDLGDPRRNRRAIRLIEHLSAKPAASIPQAWGNWADTMAAYRFFGNEEIEWTDILAPHIESSVVHMAAHAVVLCIQDATELDFNGQEASGLGLLSYEARGTRPSAACTRYPTYAVSTSREPLGVLDAWMWSRGLRDADGSRRGLKERALDRRLRALGRYGITMLSIRRKFPLQG